MSDNDKLVSLLHLTLSSMLGSNSLNM